MSVQVILKNNIALSYFIDYMTAIGCQYFVFFYLNVEGWKVSVEQQMQAMELQVLNNGENARQTGWMEGTREAALSIYQVGISWY